MTFAQILYADLKKQLILLTQEKPWFENEIISVTNNHFLNVKVHRWLHFQQIYFY